MNPRGKAVIVTGASSGIGAATARAFGAAGASVVLAARDEARLQEVARGMAGRALVAPTDVADCDAVVALVERTVAAFGGVDIVVNNAGVGLAAPVAEIKRQDFQRALDVDLFGPLALTQAALPHMRRRGRGQLIYISSVVGLRALPYLGGYAAAKAALDRLTESRERRRVGARAATPAQVAQAILRAAAREPRVAYVGWSDRLTVLLSLLAPRLADWMLGRSFHWERE